jgi:hypothetical protein
MFFHGIIKYRSRFSVLYRHELAVFHGKEKKFFPGFAVAREAR